jgi:hypothetical protein
MSARGGSMRCRRNVCLSTASCCAPGATTLLSSRFVDRRFSKHSIRLIPHGTRGGARRPLPRVAQHPAQGRASNRKPVARASYRNDWPKRCRPKPSSRSSRRHSTRRLSASQPSGIPAGTSTRRTDGFETTSEYLRSPPSRRSVPTSVCGSECPWHRSTAPRWRNSVRPTGTPAADARRARRPHPQHCHGLPP